MIDLSHGVIVEVVVPSSFSVTPVTMMGERGAPGFKTWTFSASGVLGITVLSGSAPMVNRSGSNLSVRKIHLAVGLAPQGASLDVQLYRNGTLVNTLSIPDGGTEAISNGLLNITWGEGARIQAVISGVGSIAPGSNLVGTLYTV